MNGEQLSDLFVAHSTTVGEIAGMDLATLTEQIRDLRYDDPYEDDDYGVLTSREIAIKISDYARSKVVTEYANAKDTYSRDPQWPTTIAQERWEAFPSFEEWALREYGLTAMEDHGIVLERSEE